MIAQEEGMELPELYKDVGYTRSTYFTLTSSQVIEYPFGGDGLTTSNIVLIERQIQSC